MHERPVQRQRSRVCTRDRFKDSGVGFARETGSKTVRFAQETGSKTAESGLHKRLVQRQQREVCTRDWFKDSGVRFAQETNIELSGVRHIGKDYYCLVLCS